MPIFRVKSVKIYTGQKKFTRTCPWRPWQIWGMVGSPCSWRLAKGGQLVRDIISEQQKACLQKSFWSNCRFLICRKARAAGQPAVSSAWQAQTHQVAIILHFPLFCVQCLVVFLPFISRICWLIFCMTLVVTPPPGALENVVGDNNLVICNKKFDFILILYLISLNLFISYCTGKCFCASKEPVWQNSDADQGRKVKLLFLINACFRDLKNNICQELYGEINQFENSFFSPSCGSGKRSWPRKRLSWSPMLTPAGDVSRTPWGRK